MTTRASVRDVTVLAGSGIVLAIAFIANIAHGEAALGLSQVILSLTSDDDRLLADVIQGFRLPRAVVGALAGSALALSGALMQGMLRNPMVSPGILGISAGSFFFILLAAILAPDLLAMMPIPIAVIGGWITVVAVYLLAGGLKATPLRILLAGLILSMTVSGMTDSLLIIFETEARYLIGWNAGSLRQNGWEHVQLTGPWIAAGIGIALLMARTFDVASLGEVTAAGLGQKRNLVMAGAVLIVLVMTGAAVAATGPIGFVGLVAPHLVKLTGIRRNIMLFPVSAIVGSALLLSADTLTYRFGTLTSAPPVGAITAAVGAPWLLWLVLRRSRRRGGPMGDASPMGFSRLGRLPPLWLALILVLAIAAVAVVGTLFSGGYPLSADQVFSAIFSDGTPLTERIVWDHRLPRILGALLAGGGFALAGALFQSALRNPLADSSLVGVNSGAAADILLTVALLPSASSSQIAIAALAGALTASAIVYTLAWRTQLTPTYLILIGIAVSAIFGAIVQILVIQSRYTGSNPMIWLVGSLYGANWTTVQILGMTLFAGTIGAVLIARQLELLSLGDTTARSLGAAVAPVRLVSGLIGVAVAAICTAQTGPIGYIGLLAPHLVRFLCGHSLRVLLPLSVLVGGLLLALSDIAARLIIAPAELPTGAIIALIGAPYLIYLIHRSSRA